MHEHKHSYTFLYSRFSQALAFLQRIMEDPMSIPKAGTSCYFLAVFCWFIFGTAQVTKLVRANKFVLDTVMYKVGEDAISDAFSRAADAADNTQAEGG